MAVYKFLLTPNSNSNYDKEEHNIEAATYEEAYEEALDIAYAFRQYIIDDVNVHVEFLQVD